MYCPANKFYNLIVYDCCISSNDNALPAPQASLMVCRVIANQCSVNYSTYWHTLIAPHPLRITQWLLCGAPSIAPDTSRILAGLRCLGRHQWGPALGVGGCWGDNSCMHHSFRQVSALQTSRFFVASVGLCGGVLFAYVYRYVSESYEDIHCT